MIKKVRYLELKEDENFFEFQPFSPSIGLVAHNHWFIKSFQEKSKYFGYWVELKNGIYKIISDIWINEEIEEIEVLNPTSINLIVSNNKIKIYLDEEGLNLETLSSPVFLTLLLDCRKLYSDINYGNIYKILPDSNCYFVNFTQEFEKYELNFKIIYEGNLRYVNEPLNIEFDYDLKRNSPFYTFTILKGFEGYVSKLKIICEDKEPLKIIYKDHPNNIKKFILNRIYSLYHPQKGFKAGLLWFPERWFRDELLSLLFLNKEISEKEEIMQFYLDNLKEIWHKNKLNDSILAADTFLLIVNNLNDELIVSNRESLIKILNEWGKMFAIDNLPSKSTWMDTLDRPRAVEIDFLYYNTLKKLKLDEKAAEFKMKFKTNLFLKTYPESEFYSPNLFLGYLLSKDFFEEYEWFNFFDLIIQNFYLKWGGFATKSIYDPNFYKFHTGEDSKSYHHGDSWFWINNLGAYILQSLSQIKYENYIKKIKEASLKNLFAMGVLGYMSELSSAEELRYEGSPIQLWSMSSLYLIL
ncbi:MAG: amylo-alpha-1,6-glucosidase [Minisyncoccia bacterium]|jgi:hypothetical protein